MPTTPQSFIIDPQGVTLDIDVHTVAGGAAVTYSTRNGSVPMTLPIAISTPTEFFFASGTASRELSGTSYVVSAQFGTVEVAGARSATATVEAHNWQPATWTVVLGDGSLELANLLDDAGSGGGVDSTSLPLGAMSATREVADDLEVGEGGGTSARMLVLPTAVDGGFVTVFQCKFEGDAYARLVIVSDGSYYFGDGTFNPLDGGAPSAAFFPSYTSGRVALNIKGGGNNTAIVIDKDGKVLINGVRFVDGTIAIATTVAPADADLNTSEFALWLDDTVGATALKIKAKDSAGTVRTATVPLT